MKGKNFLLLTITIIIAAVVIAFIQWGLKYSTVSRSGGDSESTAYSEHKEDDSFDNSRLVYLSEEQIKQFGVEMEVAGPGKLQVEITLPGELVLNADRVAHVVPRVSGVARAVRKKLGDEVHENEIMAVIESRELADIMAELLAARERLILAESNFEREEKVWLKRISPERDFIEAKNKLAEARIELHTAEQKLGALGFSNEYLARLSMRSDRTSLLYEVKAPFRSTVIEKHISLGEVLSDEVAVFVVADLGTVWVNLDVQQKDLMSIRVGQRARIEVPNTNIRREGRIDFIEPVATATNRTIHARVVLSNRDGRFRPGLFVNGTISVGDLEVTILVPNEALILMDGNMCVFLYAKEENGFELRPVNVGRRNEAYSEIISGLAAGEMYVTKEPFILKSELGKPEADHH